MNIWIVAAADDASFANIPKSLTASLSTELLKAHGIQISGDVRAWGAKNGEVNNTNVLARMKEGDLCLFYTQSTPGSARSYNWAASVRGVVQSKSLAEAIWGDPAFELIYFLNPATAVRIEKSTINQLLGYGPDYFPRGLMRPKISAEQVLHIAEIVNVHHPRESTMERQQSHVCEVGFKPNEPTALTIHISAYCRSRGFWFPPSSLRRLYASLRAKPFVILAGNSGTGKSRLVRLFSEASGATIANGRFTMIPVRPDWNDSSELLGFFDLGGSFIPGQLIAPILLAHRNPEKPFFVCLDEMNLARVEHYFSDFLSIIESRRKDGLAVTTDPILKESHLQKMKADGLSPTVLEALNHLKARGQALGLPANLYVVGTVNMDESTQPFSRKVLDRANTIEFNDIDLLQGLDEEVAASEVPPLDLGQAFFRTEFTTLNDLLPAHRDKAKVIAQTISDLNQDLGLAGFEVGYRVRDEATSFAVYASDAGLSDEEVNEAIVLQKILPRVQGSSPRVEKLLMSLLKRLKGDSDVPDENDPELSHKLAALRVDGEASAIVRKIAGMLILFREENFTSFWLA